MFLYDAEHEGIISGHEVAVFSLVFKFKNSPPDLRSEAYVLKNGYRMYAFTYDDASLVFDSAQNKEIRN
jgi:hypothetical protein